MASRIEKLSGASQYETLSKARKAASSEKLRSYACLSKKSEEVFRRVNQERIAMEMVPRTRFSKAAEANGLTIDVLSITRNSLLAGATFQSAETVAKVISVFNGLTVAGGSLGVFSGYNLARTVAPKMAQDYKNGNWEGGFDNGALAAMGFAYGTLSSGLVISNASSLAGSAATAAAGGLLTTVAGSGMYGIMAIWSGYGITANHFYRNELKAKESQGTLAAMQWLADQVRDSSSEATLRKQWDRFTYRTSEACCRITRETLTPEFLTRVEAQDPAALKQAEFLLQEVKKANAKQLMKHYLFLTIAILGFAALVTGLLFATGPASPFLFALGAVIWITVDSTKVHEKLGNRLFGRSLIPEAKLRPKIESIAPLQKRTPWLKPAAAAVGLGAAAYAAPNPMLRNSVAALAEGSAACGVWDALHSRNQRGGEMLDAFFHTVKSVYKSLAKYYSQRLS